MSAQDITNLQKYHANSLGAGVASKVPAGSIAGMSADGDVHLCDASDFYNLIASVYDGRNTTALLDTHREVGMEVDIAAVGNETTAVLDLGGGTGRLVAGLFFGRRDISWCCVDKSAAMMEQFRTYLKGFGFTVEFIEADIHDLAVLEGRVFDVVLLSFVLTSLQNRFDFAVVARMLRSGGCCIVADIDPTYTATFPTYSATLLDGRKVGLRMSPVYPGDVIRELRTRGFRSIESRNIARPDGTKYSYVVVARL